MSPGWKGASAAAGPSPGNADLRAARALSGSRPGPRDCSAAGRHRQPELVAPRVPADFKRNHCQKGWKRASGEGCETTALRKRKE